jgi:hypothetical protein
MKTLVRIVPLAGVVYAVLALAGNGSIGPFPDENTPIAKLETFYSTHHAGVERGGLILYWAALFLALFALSLWARLRHNDLHPLTSGALLLGATLTVAGEFDGAGTYSTLGAIGNRTVIAPAALQALHVHGAGGSPINGNGGLMIMLLAVAAAGIATRALPRWLSWSALPLGLVQLTPVGFYASLVFWLWAAVAGIYMTLRPDAAPARREAPAAASLAGSPS